MSTAATQSDPVSPIQFLPGILAAASIASILFMPVGLFLALVAALALPLAGMEYRHRRWINFSLVLAAVVLNGLMLVASLPVLSQVAPEGALAPAVQVP